MAAVKPAKAAKINGKTATAEPPPEPPAPEPSTSPPTFHPGFAVLAGLVALGLVVWTLAAFGVFTARLGLDSDDWDELAPLAKLAAKVTVPLVVVGVALIAIGAWMAVVEWRGTFKPEPTVKIMTFDLSTTITAVGKLKGAALVMVVGALLLLGAAWMVKDLAAPPSTSTTSVTTEP